MENAAYLILAVIVILVIIGAFYFYSSPEEASATINLDAQNNSGQSGEATITNNGSGKAVVKVVIQGATSTVAQPAHLHVGACPNPGDVKYALNDVVNGASETVLEVSMEEVLNNLPLALNVHKSAAELSQYVACGDVKK